MHGGQGHSGRSKGDQSASQSVAPSAQVQRSAPAVRPGVGGGILGSPRLSALFEALGPIRTQRLSDHIVGLPAVFRLGDPGWPVEDGLLLLLLGAGAAQDPLPGLRVLRLPLRQGLDREGRPAGGVGAADHTVAGGPLEDADLWRGPRGKAIVLNHNGHFGRRFGFPALLSCDLQFFFQPSVYFLEEKNVYKRWKKSLSNKNLRLYFQS